MAIHAHQAATAYQHLGVQSAALGASQHHLITMLFDGAAAAMRKARVLHSVGETGGRGTALSKAIDIIDRGLRAALDFERGGELATQLDSLYEYMIRRLMLANLRGDMGMVSEVERLLDNVASAWKQIG